MLAFGYFRATSLHGLGWQDLGTDGGGQGGSRGLPFAPALVGVIAPGRHGMITRARSCRHCGV